MLVDPEILRAFAAQTTTTAGVIDENTLKGAVSQGFAGMSGSSCLWVARLVDEFAAGLTEALSEGLIVPLGVVDFGSGVESRVLINESL